MEDVCIIKYEYDSVIVIEETHGEMSHKWLARMRDGGGTGTGHTKREAVFSLVQNLREEATRIEEAAILRFGAK